MTKVTPLRSNGFIKLDRSLLRTKAFTNLSSNGTRLLIGLIDRHTGSNNGNIRYSVKQAMTWLHCGSDTASRAFAELQTAGLIEITHKASFNNKAGAQGGVATAWQLRFLSGNKINSMVPEIEPYGT